MLFAAAAFAPASSSSCLRVRFLSFSCSCCSASSGVVSGSPFGPSFFDLPSSPLWLWCAVAVAVTAVRGRQAAQQQLTDDRTNCKLQERRPALLRRRAQSRSRADSDTRARLNAPLVAIVLVLIVTSPAVTSMTSRAAIAQLRSTSSKRANLLSVARCTGWAKREGASMLFLPECLGFMGDSARHTLASADPPIDTLLRRDAPTEADSEVRKMLADAIEGCSREGGNCDGPAGGRRWQSPAGRRARRVDNTRAAVRGVAGEALDFRDGRIRAHYHKIHLFDVSIPGKVALRESNTTDPGGELVVVDSPLGRLGLGICYDMRFPEMYVELVRRGAEVLLAPSAFTVPTGRAHWHALLRGKSPTRCPSLPTRCPSLLANELNPESNRATRSSCNRGTVLHDRRGAGGKAQREAAELRALGRVRPLGELLADAGGYDSPGVEACEEEGEEDSPIKAPSVIVVDIVPGRVAE
ncbi:hypothetical protein THAOC_33077, partial [Thalassiosira oceanica]